jgi:hypothetical protein
VHSPFEKLNLPKDLACEFLCTFARFEYSLKARGFTRGDEKSAEANWDLFGRTIDAGFNPQQHKELAIAVGYLLGEPPKKQVLTDNQIEWKDVPPDVNLPCAERVLLMVRRVRNNLFHGGKFLQGENPGGDRDRLLVEYSLLVLRACIPLHEGVSLAYSH